MYLALFVCGDVADDKSRSFARDLRAFKYLLYSDESLNVVMIKALLTHIFKIKRSVENDRIKLHVLEYVKGTLVDKAAVKRIKKTLKTSLLYAIYQVCFL